MRPRIAITTLSDCEGCVVSLIDLGEDFLNILRNVELTYAPELMDIINDYWKADVCIVMGCVASRQDVEEVKILRKRCRKIVAYGTCAVYGGIPGLSILLSRKELLSVLTKDFKSLEPLLMKVKPVNSVIDVDYIIPGCPPPQELILKVLQAALNNEPQPALPTRTVCDECPLNSGKEKVMLRFERWVESSNSLDPNKCLLEQGFLCLGFITRAGCNAQCPRAGSICTGCMGFVDEDMVRGLGRLLGGLGTAIKNLDLDKAILKIPDPIGMFLRYVLPSIIEVVNHED